MRWENGYKENGEVFKTKYLLVFEEKSFFEQKTHN